MRKLPLISSRELIKYLKTYDFQLVHTKGSHHVLRNSTGKPITVPERNQVGKGLLLAILAKAGIDRDKFLHEYS